MSGGRTTSASVDNLVFDFYASGSDAILQDRRGIVNPITVGNASFADNADFCRQSLQPWKRDLSKTLILDLYIFDPKINKHILMERWKFHYQRNTEMKDTKQLGIISRRILTLLRTLYCFVRMMPGFNLINISAKPPTLSFQLYEQKSTYPTSFVNEISRYSFTPVSTSKGTLTVSVRFITSLAVKDILTNINSVISNGGHSRRNSRTAEENGSTAAIPIPSTDPHLNNHHHIQDPNLTTNTSGKYSTSLDATDNSSSSHGSGGGGSQGTTTGLAAGLAGAVPPGSTPPLGSRYSRNSRERERDAHRRSFQLHPHAEHGGEWYQSADSGSRGSEGREDVDEAVRQLNAQAPRSALGAAGQQAQAHHQQASSLDSYANAHGHMHRLSFDGGNFNHISSSNNKSKRTSPSHYLQQQQPQQRTSNSGSYGGTTTAATSYGNTPPFLLGEMQARQQQLAMQQQGGAGGGSGSSSTGERISGGSYADMLLQQDLNNPFPVVSGSLTSTSPHFGTSTMMALIDQHRNNNRANPDNNSLSTYGASKTGRISPNNFSVSNGGELKLSIAPLPSSPFVHLSRGSFSEDGSKAALVPAFTPQRPSSFTTANNAGSLGRSLANLSLSLAPPPGDDNTLDTLRLQQFQQQQQQHSQYPWYDQPGRAYSQSGDVADASGGVRQLSKESNASSLDLGTCADPALEEFLEEDMPFAWTEADSNHHPYLHSNGTSASLLLSPAVDSVGAQLLHGLSIHSSSSAAAPLQGQFIDNNYHPYDQHRVMGHSSSNHYNMSNSTYTAAGLSGELASKINDFKNLSSTFSAN